MLFLYKIIKILNTKNRLRKLLSASATSFLWTIVVAIISTSPILGKLVISSIRSDIQIDIDQILINGSILFISLGIAGSAWVLYSFSKIKNQKFFRLLVNFIFILIVGFAFVIYGTLTEENGIVMQQLLKYNLILFSVSLIYCWSLKAVLNLDELLQKIDIQWLNNERINLILKIKKIIDEKEKEKVIHKLQKENKSHRSEQLELKHDILELKELVKQLKEE